MDTDDEKLCRFLVNAKIHTYASGRKASTLKDGSKELMFNKGEFSYRDRYFGENPFIGEETVFYEGKCFWGMNYYGCIVSSEDFSLEGLVLFLREALKRVGEEKPFRGPEKYVERAFRYVNNVEGSVRRFSGTEKIFCRRREVYKLLYHGGYVET